MFNCCSRPEDEDVAFAANIAAYYSKARTEGKVPVVKASVADLKKPKGMAPGKVSACIFFGQLCPLSWSSVSAHRSGPCPMTSFGCA